MITADPFRIDEVLFHEDGRIEVRYTDPGEDGVLPDEWGGTARTYTNPRELLASPGPLAFAVQRRLSLASSQNFATVSVADALEAIARLEDPGVSIDVLPTVTVAP